MIMIIYGYNGKSLGVSLILCPFSRIIIVWSLGPEPATTESWPQ